MIVYLLVVMLNPGYTNATSFTVPGIASARECQRLGNLMRPRYASAITPADIRCYAYRAAR